MFEFIWAVVYLAGEALGVRTSTKQERWLESRRAGD